MPWSLDWIICVDVSVYWVQVRSSWGVTNRKPVHGWQMCFLWMFEFTDPVFTLDFIVLKINEVRRVKECCMSVNPVWLPALWSLLFDLCRSFWRDSWRAKFHWRASWTLSKASGRHITSAVHRLKRSRSSTGLSGNRSCAWRRRKMSRRKRIKGQRSSGLTVLPLTGRLASSRCVMASRQPSWYPCLRPRVQPLACHLWTRARASGRL